jgi:hypothetical protein
MMDLREGWEGAAAGETTGAEMERLAPEEERLTPEERRAAVETLLDGALRLTGVATGAALVAA